MSETFDKLLENRDYWRDEAKASWANIEVLEVGNSRLEEEIAELRKEIHRLQGKDDERLDSYAERTYQLIEAQKELEKWQLLMINHTMGGAWESVADFIKDQSGPAVFSLPSDRWKIKLEDADDVRMADVERVEYMGLKLMKDPLEVPDLTSAKARLRKLAERKTKEAMETVAQGVSKLNLDLTAWAKRQEDDQETQDLAKFNKRFIDPDSLKSGLSVELEGTASQEVFDLIMGKQPEQELREITMVAKIVDDQPAHEAARPPRRTRRRIRRYRRWPR